MQDSQEHAGKEITIGIENDSESNSPIALDSPAFEESLDQEVPDFENSSKIARRAFHVVMRYFHWFIFVEVIHSTLSALAAMLQSITLISHFAQEHSYAGVLKTVLTVIGLTAFAIIALHTGGLVLIIPFAFLFVYGSQAHVFSKVQKINNQEFVSEFELRVDHKFDDDKFGNDKLVAIYKITLTVCIAFIILLSLLTLLTEFSTGTIVLTNRTLQLEDVYYGFSNLLLYAFLCPYVRLSFVIIYVQKVYGRTLRSTWSAYSEFFPEFFPITVLYSLLVGGIVGINLLVMANYVNNIIGDTLNYVSVLILFIAFYVESTFWVMFVNSRLHALRKFIIDCDINETRMIAMGTTETGKVLRRSAYLRNKRSAHTYVDKINTDEDVWGVKLEDVEDVNESENSENADDSTNSDAKINEN